MEMRNNVRKKMETDMSLFDIVLLAGFQQQQRDRKNQKSGGRKCCKKEMVCKTDGTIYQWKNDSWRIKRKRFVPKRI